MKIDRQGSGSHVNGTQAAEHPKTHHDMNRNINTVTAPALNATDLKVPEGLLR